MSFADKGLTGYKAMEALIRWIYQLILCQLFQYFFNMTQKFCVMFRCVRFS